MSVLRLPTVKRMLGFRLESNANKYTNNETLSTIDYCFSAYNIEFSTEIESYLRQLAYGDFSKSTSVSGRRKATVSWSIDWHEHATADQAPMFWTMLRACGLQQNSNASTGTWLVPHAAYDNVPASIEVVLPQEGVSPSGLVIKVFGAMGNARIVSEQVGQPPRVEFEFEGVLGSITTRASGSMITPASFDTNLPPAILSATINLFGTTQYLGRWTLDIGNQRETYSDPSKAQGYDGTRIANRNPVLELDPDMRVTDDIDLLTNQTTNTTGALSIVFDSRTTISAPAAQYVQTYSPVDREGHVANQLRLELKRSSGNDEFEFLQGSKT